MLSIYPRSSALNIFIDILYIHLQCRFDIELQQLVTRWTHLTYDYELLHQQCNKQNN